MKEILKFTFLIIFSFNAIFIYSQDYSDEKGHYIWFDSIIGVDNTGLFNGTEYKEKYRTKKGNHKFYQSSQYLIGNIVYDEQPYFNVKMKYDVFEDEIIIKSPYLKTYFIIKLIKDKINNFTINNHHFVKISINKEGKSENTSGFYELIFKNKNLTLLKKYKKNINSRLEKTFAYSEFKENNEFKIYLNGYYYSLKSKRDLIKIFPNLKKVIKKFYNSNKALQKSNLDMFMKSLVKQLKPNNLSK